MGTISMILCEWNGYWYIAVRADPNLIGCALRVGMHMRSADGFENNRYNAYRGRSLPSLDGLTFYPELRYKGYRVWPMNWHPESEEPLLLCFMDHSEVSGGGWPPTEKRMKALMEDGWAWNQREGGEKFVHVDDLEKIEGPPPQGAF